MEEGPDYGGLAMRFVLSTPPDILRTYARGGLGGVSAEELRWLLARVEEELRRRAPHGETRHAA